MNARRNWLPVLGAILLPLLLLSLQHLALERASAGSGGQAGQWVHFPVASTPGMLLAGVDVGWQRIVWAQEDVAPCGEVPSANRAPAEPELDHDLCAFDLRSGAVISVTADPGMNVWPRTDGNWSVFHVGGTAAGGTAAQQHVSGERIVIPFPGGNSGQANVQGDTAVFATTSGSAIYAYNLAARQLVTVTTDAGNGLANPDVYGSLVVWQQAGGLGGSDILAYDLATNTPLTLSARLEDELTPRIDGHLVVWSAAGNIYGYDLQSSQRLTITEAPETQVYPAVSGQRIVWMDNRHGSWDVFAYDLATQTETRVTQAPTDEMYPAVWGDVITWETWQMANQQALGVDAARWTTAFGFLPIVRH